MTERLADNRQRSLPVSGGTGVGRRRESRHPRQARCLQIAARAEQGRGQHFLLQLEEESVSNLVYLHAHPLSSAGVIWHIPLAKPDATPKP